MLDGHGQACLQGFLNEAMHKSVTMRKEKWGSRIEMMGNDNAT